jgi:CubicO group peptidase (beta-lactamase class C family)
MDLAKDQIDELFSQWDRERSPGCVLGIIQAGEILYQQGYGRAELEHDVPIDGSTVFDIGSTSKQFTAACVLLLVRERKLDLEDDVRNYIPSLPEFNRTIRIRHLVHHMSGIRDYLNLAVLSGRPVTNDYSEDEIIDLLSRQRGLEFRTGSRFGYSNSGYLLLGEIVRSVSGLSLREFAQKHIFGPLGMTSTLFRDDFAEVIPNRATAYSQNAEDGFRINVSIWDVVGDGAVFTNINDLAIWDRQFYECQLPGGTEFIEQLTTPGKLDKKVGSQSDYAFGLTIGNFRGERTISHGGAWGGYRAEMLRLPDKRLTIVVLANLGSLAATDLAYRTAGIVLAEDLQSEASPSPESPAAAPAEVDASDWRGFYRDRRLQMIAELLADESGHSLRVFGQTFRLEDSAPSRLRLQGVPAEIEFSKKNELILHLGRQKPIRLSLIEEDLPSQDELESLIGRYYSRELDATYTLDMEEGSLKTRRAWMSAEDLIPAGGDLFSAGPCVIEIRRRSGRPVGFRLRMSRVGSLNFTRQKTARDKVSRATADQSKTQ